MDKGRWINPTIVTQKAKEFTLCLEEIAKNFDRQHSAIAASSTVGKQLAQSFATYSKVAGFHQPVYPIAEFLSKSNSWLNSTEELSSKLVGNLNDKTTNPTKDNLKTQTLTLKAIKQKKRTQTSANQSHHVPKKENPLEKKTSEQCAWDIEEMTMNSLYCFWECYLEYYEECHKLMSKVKDGLKDMKKLSADTLKVKKLGAKKIFGVPLEELAEREAPAHLPQVVENMLISISNVVSLEGIFRVSGSKTSIDALRDQIDSGVQPDFNAVMDSHTVPTLFKSFLRMMPTPLIPYDAFLALPSLTAPNISVDTIVTHLRELVNNLPPAHYYLLGRLLSLCQKIVAEKAKSKMTASNLSVVIGPNIIRPPDSAAASTPESFGDSNTVVQLLVEHFDALYPEKTAFIKNESEPEVTPPQTKSSARKLRAHGITIDRNTVINLNYEADVALGNSQEGMHAPALSSSQSLPNVRYATDAPDEADSHWDTPSSPRSPPLSPRGALANLGGTSHDATVPHRPPARPARPNLPHQAAVSEAKSTARTPPVAAASAQPNGRKNSPAPVPARSHANSKPPNSTSPPTKSPLPPSSSSAPPAYPPPSPSAASPYQSPPFIHNTPSTPSPANGKKVIGLPPNKKPPGSPPKSSPISTPSHALATSHSAPNLSHTVAHGSAAHARAPAQGKHPVAIIMDAPFDVVKSEISKSLAIVIEQQLGLVRGKLVDVKSIPDGVPFIHVLKAITPELDKLKKIMPTPPTFEKLPDMPLEYNKFARLKFTLDFALKDLTRVLEQVATFAAAQENPNDTTLLQQIHLSVSELQRVLSCNIAKL